MQKSEYYCQQTDRPTNKQTDQQYGDSYIPPSKSVCWEMVIQVYNVPFGKTEKTTYLYQLHSKDIYFTVNANGLNRMLGELI